VSLTEQRISILEFLESQHSNELYIEWKIQSQGKRFCIRVQPESKSAVITIHRKMFGSTILLRKAVRDSLYQANRTWKTHQRSFSNEAQNDYELDPQLVLLATAKLTEYFAVDGPQAFLHCLGDIRAANESDAFNWLSFAMDSAKLTRSEAIQLWKYLRNSQKQED